MMRQVIITFSSHFTVILTSQHSGLSYEMSNSFTFTQKYNKNVYRVRSRTVLTNRHTGHVPRDPDLFILRGARENFYKYNYVIYLVFRIYLQ